MSERTLTQAELNRAVLARQSAAGPLEGGHPAGARADRVTIEPFEPLSKAARGEVEAEASRLAEFCA